MNLTFPIIKTIDDVLPHIDREKFSVNQKDDYIVIDYILSLPELFHNPWEKECRGLIFHEDGRIMSRRLHKFFNYGERPETLVDISKPHVILEKLDGSMITPLMVNGKLTWGSKAGVTFLTPMVEEWVAQHPTYKQFALDCFEDDVTPIFEFCTNRNRIVISHPEERLVLIALRDNFHGNYSQYWKLESLANLYDLEVVQALQSDVQSLQHFSDQVRGMTGIEGFVVRFDDGEMIKFKGEEYCKFHTAKDSLIHEKNVIACIVSGNSDDFRVLLSPEDRAKFEAFEMKFWAGVEESAQQFLNLCETYNTDSFSKKDYALEVASQKGHTPFQKNFVFYFFDYVSIPIQAVKREIVDKIKKSLSSQTTVDRVRELFGGEAVRWSYG